MANGDVKYLMSLVSRLKQLMFFTDNYDKERPISSSMINLFKIYSMMQSMFTKTFSQSHNLVDEARDNRQIPLRKHLSCMALLVVLCRGQYQAIIDYIWTCSWMWRTKNVPTYPEDVIIYPSKQRRRIHNILMQVPMLYWYHFPNMVISCWRHQMETFSALLALCEGNPPVTGGFPSQSQCRGDLMFSLVCAWTNNWANNRDVDGLRRHSAHYDVRLIWSKFQLSSFPQIANQTHTLQTRNKHHIIDLQWMGLLPERPKVYRAARQSK